MNMQSKSVAIKDLPQGYFKERLSTLAINDDVEITVVASAGHINDWACYVGWPTFDELKPDVQCAETHYYATNVHEPLDVRARGDKFSEREAKELFPEWANRSYRE